MSLIPIDIVNKILLYREKHPVAKLLCCRICKDHEYWKFPVKYSTTTRREKIDYFNILCADCLYDWCKYK